MFLLDFDEVNRKLRLLLAIASDPIRQKSIIEYNGLDQADIDEINHHKQDCVECQNLNKEDFDYNIEILSKIDQHSLIQEAGEELNLLQLWKDLNLEERVMFRNEIFAKIKELEDQTEYLSPENCELYSKIEAILNNKEYNEKFIDIELMLRASKLIDGFTPMVRSIINQIAEKNIKEKIIEGKNQKRQSLMDVFYTHVAETLLRNSF